MKSTHTALAALINSAKSPAAGVPRGASPASVLWATVISVQVGSLTVTLAGSTTHVAGVKYLESYVPNAGDVVMVIQAGSDLLVIGTAGASSAPPLLRQAGAQMVINAAQTVAQGTTVGFNGAAADDPLGMIVNSGGINCMFQIPAGWPTLRYVVAASMFFTNPGTTGSQDARIYLRKNPGGANTGVAGTSRGGVAGNTYMSLPLPSAEVQLAAGDQIQLQINNSDAAHGSITSILDTSLNWASIAAVGGW